MVWAPRPPRRQHLRWHPLLRLAAGLSALTHRRPGALPRQSQCLWRSRQASVGEQHWRTG
eukprot:scaffold89669_cov43-Phaeocystis_antarctica.AAC.1